MSRSTRTVLLCLAAALSACKSEAPKIETPPPAEPTPPPMAAADPLTITYGPDLKIDMSKMTKTVNGVYYIDQVVGKGARADSGKAIKVKYAGFLSNGVPFESNEYELTLGAAQVIDGWDQGIPGMKVGGKRQIVIPSALAYGEAGQGQIPPGAVLVFTIDLLSVK